MPLWTAGTPTSSTATIVSPLISDISMLDVAPASASRREIRASVSLSVRTRADALGTAAGDGELDAAVERLDQLGPSAPRGPAPGGGRPPPRACR